MRNDQYVATHPWLWRLGWLPWQLTAWADFLLSLALVFTPWIPRRGAMAALLITIAAIIPDQIGQFLWITRGVALARQAIAAGNIEFYLRFERPVFLTVGGIGCIGYLCAALAWTACFARAGTWNRRLTWLSAITWGMFAIAVVLFFLPGGIRPAKLIAALNAVGFVLLEVWLIAVTECVLRRSRPCTAFGGAAPWRHPRAGWIGGPCDLVANSLLLRRLLEWLPAPALASDIQDAIYINYLVEADRLRALIPERLELQCLGPANRWALFSILTYRHGHFGPPWLGPFRRLMPSPIQSNWRAYVVDPATGRAGVWFLTTAITHTPAALLARLLCEGVPMHVPESAGLSRDAIGVFHVSLNPGSGSAPRLQAELREWERPILTGAWDECFGNFAALLAYCVPQNCALSPRPWYRQMVRQEIDVGVPLESCRALVGPVQSATVRHLLGQVEPICFYAPSVAFRFHRELHDA